MYDGHDSFVLTRLCINDSHDGRVVTMGYDVTVRQFMFKQVNGERYGVQLENCDVLLLPGLRLFSHDPVSSVGGSKCNFGWLL